MQPENSIDKSLADIGVLIPAWRPGPELLILIQQLQSGGFGAVIVIDDGSGPEFSPIFTAIEQRHGFQVLRHPVNLGKGRALKTGFNWVLSERLNLRGVVSADADGQHKISDILAVANTLCADPGRLILGVRSFGHGVPVRCWLGNILTRNIFRLATGTRLADTQTGLRGIPRNRLEELIRLEGERYEFEMTMLAHLCRNGQHPVQVPISTVYIDGNRSSHFDPIRDSVRIYSVLVRLFSFSAQRSFVFKRSPNH